MRNRTLLGILTIVLSVSWPSLSEASLTYQFSATSQGYSATGSEGFGAFARNGIQFLIRFGGAGGGRGINITVVHERTGDVLDFRNFDLWADGEPAADAMIDFLTAVPAGRIVLFAVGDEAGLMRADACEPKAGWVESVYSVLELFGSEHIREVCFRQAWAMISKKGVVPGRAESFGTGGKTALSTMKFPAAVAVKGVDYSPFRDGQAPWGPCPSLANVQADMPLLKAMANRVRFYGLAGCDLGHKILTATNAASIRTAVGVWLGADLPANEAEVERLRQLVASNLLKKTDVVVVGSEVLSRNELTVDQLIGYITRVKAIVAPKGLPVATAEIWPIWLGARGAALAAAVDQILMNALPYWEELPVANAAASVLGRFQQVWSAHPFKRVIISETGWPTGGPPYGAAIPSLENQQTFLSGFLCQAQKKRVPTFVFEAFDEVWKASTTEGEVGAHWGFFDSNRTPKQPFSSLKACPK
jgi:exo-beta-1,3-glucanase (GH17 family)